MKVLFICVENSCRSQMAEGFARRLGLLAQSAGVRAGAGVNVQAIEVMQEIGIDIASHFSKPIDYESLGQYDAVISMCSVKTQDVCPSTFIGTQANWHIDDPKGESIDVFRRVRDEIGEKVAALVKSSSDSGRQAV